MPEEMQIFLYFIWPAIACFFFAALWCLWQLRPSSAADRRRQEARLNRPKRPKPTAEEIQYYRDRKLRHPDDSLDLSEGFVAGVLVVSAGVMTACGVFLLWLIQDNNIVGREWIILAPMCALALVAFILWATG